MVRLRRTAVAVSGWNIYKRLSFRAERSGVAESSRLWILQLRCVQDDEYKNLQSKLFSSNTCNTAIIENTAG